MGSAKRHMAGGEACIRFRTSYLRGAKAQYLEWPVAGLVACALGESFSWLEPWC
jgi:hypothetical protein